MYLGRDGRKPHVEPVGQNRASIRPQMYLGRDKSNAETQLRRKKLQFGPRCIWGETLRRDRHAGINEVLLQFGPRCIWGETLPRGTFTSSRAPVLQFGPRCIWGETSSASARTSLGANRFNSAPDVSGERHGRHRAPGERPLSFNSAPDVSGERRVRPRVISRVVNGFNSAPDVSGERHGRNQRFNQRSDRRFNSAPDVSGERPLEGSSLRRGRRWLQFGPRCIWGETRTPTTTPAGTRCFNSAPDVSGERHVFTSPGGVLTPSLQFGPRCIWGRAGALHLVVRILSTLSRY
ncbi:unnamed protein product [Gemmata massiliana]|uniref:Uncharacterized protein n=1 Tax=Gemmata massiliana TaxID=1210884 RepID=A0A6P2CYI1_9BACT|nr:unnamed protein product [Gemmata massiliana]